MYGQSQPEQSRPLFSALPRPLPLPTLASLSSRSMYAVIVDLLQLLLLASTLRTWLKVNVNELVEQQWRRPLNYGNNFALPCLAWFCSPWVPSSLLFLLLLLGFLLWALAIFIFINKSLRKNKIGLGKLVYKTWRKITVSSSGDSTEPNYSLWEKEKWQTAWQRKVGRS